MSNESDFRWSQCMSRAIEIIALHPPDVGGGTKWTPEYGRVEVPVKEDPQMVLADEALRLATHLYNNWRE